MHHNLHSPNGCSTDANSGTNINTNVYTIDQCSAECWRQEDGADTVLLDVTIDLYQNKWLVRLCHPENIKIGDGDRTPASNVFFICKQVPNYALRAS